MSHDKHYYYFSEPSARTPLNKACFALYNNSFDLVMLTKDQPLEPLVIQIDNVGAAKY